MRLNIFEEKNTKFVNFSGLDSPILTSILVRHDTDEDQDKNIQKVGLIIGQVRGIRHVMVSFS